MVDKNFLKRWLFVALFLASFILLFVQPGLLGYHNIKTVWKILTAKSSCLVPRSFVNHCFDASFGEPGEICLSLNGPETSIVSEELIEYGNFEKHLIEDFFRRTENLFRESDAVLDVGANIGWWTFNIAKRGITTYSFEADPFNFNLLQQSKTKNPHLKGNVNLFKACLGSSSDAGKIIHFAANERNADNKKIWNHEEKNAVEGSNSCTSCEVQPLDYFLDKIVHRIVVMKVDIESYEPMFFDGAQEFLKKHQPKYIYVEVYDSQKPKNDAFCAKYGYNRTYLGNNDYLLTKKD